MTGRQNRASLPSKAPLYYHWAEGKTRKVLTLLGGKQRLLTARLKSGDFALHLIDHTEGASCPVSILGWFPSMEAAQEMGEAFGDARFGVNYLGRLGEAWRSKPPSPDQLRSLHGAAIERWRGMTNGEASDLLALHYVNKAMRKFHDEKNT